MLFCISSSDARLITLRAYPECSDFCNAVDKSCGVSTLVSVPNEAGISQQAREHWSADPITSSWLPGPSQHEPAAASRPSSTSCMEPNSMHQRSTGLSPGHEAQQTYTRRRQNGSDAGKQAKRSRPADYAWLQGADDTPATTAQHGRQGLLWWNSEAGQSDEAQMSSEGCNAATAVTGMGSHSLQDTLVR
ncbi:hypothetical protein ABBQ38_009823 [Trebouxia sp. C0009 RCD-2024]